MTGIQDYHDVIGRTAVDNEGHKIGKIGQIYVDDTTNEPQWVTVSTGLFGTKESFAPLRGSRRDGDDLQLAVSKAQIKDAPNVDADGQLEESENGALYDYYSDNTATKNVESVRAKMRKYVVTENVSQTVPVSHEEVRIERVTLGADTDRTGHSDR